jgi:hypothetical protein
MYRRSFPRRPLACDVATPFMLDNLEQYGKRFVGRHSSETRTNFPENAATWTARTIECHCLRGQGPSCRSLRSISSPLSFPLLVFPVGNIDADYYSSSLIAETLIRGKLPFHHALQMLAS